MIIALDTAHIADANRPNEPFQIIGRLIPTYTHGGWQAEEELLPEPHMKTYEEEEIDWAQYINQPDKHVFLAYEEKQFAGRIVLRRDWNRYAFIEDIAVTMAPGRAVGARAGSVRPSTGNARHQSSSLPVLPKMRYAYRGGQHHAVS